MVDLGSLGGAGSFGTRINAVGRVAGSSFLAGGTSAQFRAFLWKPGIRMTDLGFLGYSTGFIESNVVASATPARWLGTSSTPLSSAGMPCFPGRLLPGRFVPARVVRVVVRERE